jgi:hypothetical protein
MPTPRNPKQEGTPFWDCIVQTGECPMRCNQCFYNRPGAYYVPLEDMPLIPDPEEVGDGIVRMNCGHDSGFEMPKVIEQAAKYKHAFFNTSIPQVVSQFPGPVVLTANRQEEQRATMLAPPPKNLMFVRLRTSATNLFWIDMAVDHYTAWKVPVVITFMAYYDAKPSVASEVESEIGSVDDLYEWKVRHINSYWCPTKLFMRYVMNRYSDNRLVAMCSSIGSAYCRDCRNCETYYLQTQKRLRGE